MQNNIPQNVPRNRARERFLSIEEISRDIQRSRNAYLQRRRLIKQLKRLGKKINNIGLRLGISGFDVINRGINRTPAMQIKVLQFFLTALRSIENMSPLHWPRGLILSGAERKLLLIILHRKIAYQEMVLEHHRILHQRTMDEYKQRYNLVREQEVQRDYEKKLSLDRDCQARTIRSYSSQNTYQTADVYKNNNVQEKLHYWRNRIGHLKYHALSVKQFI